MLNLVVVGTSFPDRICRMFSDNDPDDWLNLMLDRDQTRVVWRTRGGLTIKKMLSDPFIPPEIDYGFAAVQIGSNDLCSQAMSPEQLLTDLRVHVLPMINSWGISHVVFCQLFRRRPGRMPRGGTAYMRLVGRLRAKDPPFSSYVEYRPLLFGHL